MKNRRNKLGPAILSLSLALALALPLNANATENTNLPNIDNTQTENTNYISQKGKEENDKIEVTSSPVEMTKDDQGAKNYFNLSYSFAIKGDDLGKDYEISVFALKEDKVKNLSLDNFIADDKVTLAEDMAETVEKIETDDIFGYKIKTNITRTGSVKAVVTVAEDDKPGAYPLYYMVTREGKSTIGRLDASLAKSGDYDFYLSNDQAKKDYDLKDTEKTNPFANLPFAKYLLNDTDKDKDLADYLDLSQANSTYKILINYINPNSDQVETYEIDNLADYKVPANSLVKFEIKEEAKELIEESEILDKDTTKEDEAGKALLSLLNDTNKEDTKEETKEEKAEPSTETLDSDVESLIAEEKSSLSKLYPDLDQKDLEVKAVTQAISKQNDKLKDMIKDDSTAPVAMLEVNGPSQAKAEALKLVEAQKKSIVEVNPEMDDTKLEIMGISQAIKAQNQKIQELIQQALLNYELDSLEKLEEENSSKAQAEYKKIADLVKEAESVSKKADKKLIELGEINLTDNTEDPIVVAKDGAKPVLNLGMLTPLTKINDLTKDSPLESERDFSTNLEKKLQRAQVKVKNVETVTIGEQENEKAKEDLAENKEDKEISQKANQKINTPIFVKYLQSLNNRKKLIDNE